MALADFFDRAATAASQALSRFDHDAFRATLENVVVGLAFDGTAASSGEGSATLDMAVTLLARLYPTLAVVPLDGDAAEMARRLRRQAREINPAIDLKRTLAGAGVGIVVGNTRPKAKAPVFFAGSDGWVAKLSRSEPVGSGATSDPFGAGAAACLAAANVFRTVFAERIEGGAPDEKIELSILDYGQPGTGGRPLGPVDLGECHLVGLGAIGNGAVWALSRVQHLTGVLHLVDHEELDLSNLQRYVLPGRDAVGQPKVDIAASLFGAGSLRAVPHRSTWSGYVAAEGHRAFERVAVALDTAGDRIAVQASLPRWIVNAWTQTGDLGVSRHGFVDGGACLACLYLPDGKVKDEDERVAEEIGLPEARMEVRNLLHGGAPVDAALIARIAAALGVPVEPLLAFEGRPLRALHQGAICGGMVFRLSGGARPAQAVVPMPFQSALAGIMLAADLVKHAVGYGNGRATTTRMDLLRPLGRYLHDPRAKDARGRCICQDPDFLAAYRHKHGEASSSHAPPSRTPSTRVADPTVPIPSEA